VFQRRPTIPAQASQVLSRVKGGDATQHPLNVLGQKSFRSLSYNPTGPQRRVVVTKKAVPTTGGVQAPGRVTGGSAPQRTFSQ
jgi:hypothetical protein